MAKKIKENNENKFIDEVSGISYQWLKEEVEPANGVSCWSAKDQWGNKDYFVVREGAIIRGPFRTVKETIKSLQEDVDTEVEVVEEPTESVEERANVGIMDELRQASNQVTEIIRRCEELKQWSEDVDKEEIISVLQSIIDGENENIGKIQAMLKALSPDNEKIEDGEEEAEKIMDDDIFGDINEDIFDGNFGIPNIPQVPFVNISKMGTSPLTPIQPMNASNINNNVVQKPAIAESVDNVDTAQILRNRFDMDAINEYDDIIGF